MKVGTRSNSTFLTSLEELMEPTTSKPYVFKSMPIAESEEYTFPTDYIPNNNFLPSSNSSYLYKRLNDDFCIYIYCNPILDGVSYE